MQGVTRRRGRPPQAAAHGAAALLPPRPTTRSGPAGAPWGPSPGSAQPPCHQPRAGSKGLGCRGGAPPHPPLGGPAAGWTAGCRAFERCLCGHGVQRPPLWLASMSGPCLLWETCACMRAGRGGGAELGDVCSRRPSVMLFNRIAASNMGQPEAGAVPGGCPAASPAGCAACGGGKGCAAPAGAGLREVFHGPAEGQARFWACAKALLRQRGLPAVEAGLHSLRRGGATAAAQRGVLVVDHGARHCLAGGAQTQCAGVCMQRPLRSGVRLLPGR